MIKSNTYWKGNICILFMEILFQILAATVSAVGKSNLSPGTSSTGQHPSPPTQSSSLTPPQFTVDHHGDRPDRHQSPLTSGICAAQRPIPTVGVARQRKLSWFWQRWMRIMIAKQDITQSDNILLLAPRVVCYMPHFTIDPTRFHPFRAPTKVQNPSIDSFVVVKDSF